MHRSVFKNLFAPLLLLAIMFGFALPASASPTWRPTFSPSQHVYLDPALKASNNPVNLDGLESSYAAESRKNGVEMYFIMTLKGDETTPGRDFAKTRVDEIMGNWGGQAGFPSDRAVVCYVVRLNNDWTKSAVACNVASELGRKGLTWQSVLAIADQYSQHRTANPDALLPQNPKGFALTVAQSVNKSVEDYAAQQVAAAQQAEASRVAAIKQAEADRQAAIEHAAAAARAAHIAEVVIPIALILIVLGVFFFRKRKASAKAAEVIAHWDEIFAVGNSNYIELEGHYLNFLKSQGSEWKDKFKGKTLTRYMAAITAYADLSARIKTAGKMLEEAKKLNTMSNIFSTADNEHAFALLTSLDVKIDSKALSFEEQGLFGALVDAKSANTKKPNELLDDMDGLFRTANTTMADIMKSFDGAAKNKGEIDALFAEVEALKASLSESALSFAAYQPVYDRIVSDKANFMAILDSDPLEAYEESQKVETACEALKVKIGKALELRKSLASTEKAIADAVSAVAAARAGAADYNYPDGGSPAAGAAVTALFNEAGANPDDDIAYAKGDLNNAIALVGAGQIEPSSQAKASAEGHAAAAVETIKKVVAAKEAVQKQVPVVHAALDKLTAEIPGGDEALASLKAGFLASNFDTAPGALKRAKEVQTATSGQLAAVKLAFFEQRYVAAAELVKAITGDIQGSRAGIVAVATRLSDLNQLRAHAKSQTAANAQTQAGLKGKLATNAFTTSASTESVFASLAQPLTSQQADVAREVTDWPAAAQAADELAHSFGTVDGAINDEKAAYDHAVATLADLRAAVQAAVQQANTDANIVRQAAHNAVGQAQQVLGQDEQAITVAKSDWNGLSRRFQASIQQAEAAQNAAIADKNAYNEAATAINDAQSNITAVENGSYATYKSIGGRWTGNYGSGVRADCSYARSLLAQASQLLNAQRYEDAENQATNAHNAAAQAQQAAEAQVQQEIAIAVAAWQAAEAIRIAEEERLAEIERQRQAEIYRQQQQAEDDRRRAQQAADDAARASQSSSNNDSWGGSSNSGGTDYSGGSNSGGTDFS